jgi:hypothetical protein
VIATSAALPAVVLGVAAVVAACLWLLFRPGSMADRARRDDADGDTPTGASSPGEDGEAPQEPTGGA